MAEETLLEKADREAKVKAWEDENKLKPKREEKRFNGKLVEVTDISDDGRVIVTRINPNGLD